MQLCQSLKEWRTAHAPSDEVALIQRGRARLMKDEAQVQVSYAQMYRWQQKLQEILSRNDEVDEWLIGINLAPFSMEETATMLLIAEQRRWTYVPIDIQLPIARQLSMLQSIGVQRLVTMTGSDLANVLVNDKERRELNTRTLDMSMDPFLSVQVFAFSSNYLHANGESSLTSRRPRDCRDLVAPLYVLFTSGTTGKDKKVLGTRTGVWTRLEWMWKTYPFAKDDRRTRERVLRATKLSFVDSVWEILGAFLQRVPLVHLQASQYQDDSSSYSYTTNVVLDDSLRFLEILRSENVTRFTAVPSVLEVLLLQTSKIDRQSCLAGLCFVLSSGEALPLHVLEQLTADLPHVTILNLYGSTELSGDVTCMELKAPLSSSQMTKWQKFGVPIASLDSCGVIGGGETSLVLLSEANQHRLRNELTTVIWPKPNAANSYKSTEITTGILYVSGPLLMNGYIGDDHGDAFVTFNSMQAGQNVSTRGVVGQSSRWYCTGDICSVIQSHLYYCGRKDNGVKIHGQRVFMESVERAVQSALRETTKLQPDDQSQVFAFTTTKKVTKHALLGPCIVACIICDNDSSSAVVTQTAKTRALNAWIAEHYGPSYIPHEVFRMPTREVPRLAHGKINRRELEKVFKRCINNCSLPLSMTHTNTNVKSASETLLARLLNELLDMPLSDDNRVRTFREIGGNSLLATLFVHELRQEFGKFILTAQDLLGMTVEDVLVVCSSSVQTQESSRNTKSVKQSIEATAQTRTFNSSDTFDAASERKRQKKTHCGSSNDNVDSGSSSKIHQQSRLTFVSRYNHSSASVNGIYLPTCFPSLVSSAKDTDSTSSSCLPWEWKQAWQADMGKCIDASPLVVQRHDHNDIVCSTWAILGSHSGQLVCVDVEAAGQELWRVQLDDRIEACAAISTKHEVVYVGTYAGDLFALRLHSGVTLWTFHAKGIIKASALVMDEQQLVVCGAYDNMLYGLNAVTGRQQWAIDLDGSLFSTPLYCSWSGQIFAATTNGAVVALQSSCKFYRVDKDWQLQLPAPVFAGLNADYTSKMLLVACADGHLYGVSMSTGDIQWQCPTDKPIFSSPCVYRPGFVVFGSHDGMLRKVACHSGKLVWTTNLHSAVFASPTVVRLLASTIQNENNDDDDDDDGDRLICCVSTTAGSVCFCDESTGSIVYQTCEESGKAMSGRIRDTELGPLFSSPVIIDKWCLIGTRTNQFLGFELIYRQSTTRSNKKSTTN